MLTHFSLFITNLNYILGMVTVNFYNANFIWASKVFVCSHRCTQGGGGGGYKIAPSPSRQIFENLFNKKAEKPKIGGSPWQFFLKALTPPTVLAKTIRFPPGFSTSILFASMFVAIFLKIFFWCAPFGYLYFRYFRVCNS
jgi:hypothetical protein